jgi:hypothetical protein
MLVGKTMAAALRLGVERIVLTGGVAANTALRLALETEAGGHRVRLHVPPRGLCTDNAAMIAAAGTARLAGGERADLTMNAQPDLALTESRLGGAPLSPTPLSEWPRGGSPTVSEARPGGASSPLGAAEPGWRVR